MLPESIQLYIYALRSPATLSYYAYAKKTLIFVMMQSVIVLQLVILQNQDVSLSCRENFSLINHTVQDDLPSHHLDKALGVYVVSV